MATSITPGPAQTLDLLDVQGVADYLNVETRTARRIVSDRRVPVIKIGALVRVRRADLDAYVSANTVEAAR